MVPYLDLNGLSHLTEIIQEEQNKKIDKAGGEINGDLSVSGNFMVGGQTIEQIAAEVMNTAIQVILNKKY